MSQLHQHSPWSIWIAILLAFCGASLVGLGVSGCVVIQPTNPQVVPTLTEVIPTVTEASQTSTPPIAGGVETLTILENIRIPAGDWRDEAIRLKGIPNIPEVVSTTPANYEPGELDRLLCHQCRVSGEPQALGTIGLRDAECLLLCRGRRSSHRK